MFHFCCLGFSVLHFIGIYLIIYFIFIIFIFMIHISFLLFIYFHPKTSFSTLCTASSGASSSSAVSAASVFVLRTTNASKLSTSLSFLFRRFFLHGEPLLQEIKIKKLTFNIPAKAKACHDTNKTSDYPQN